MDFVVVVVDVELCVVDVYDLWQEMIDECQCQVVVCDVCVEWVFFCVYWIDVYLLVIVCCIGEVVDVDLVDCELCVCVECVVGGGCEFVGMCEYVWCCVDGVESCIYYVCWLLIDSILFVMYDV